MTIGAEIPYRRSKRKDGQHTGSLVLDQHRKATAEHAEAEDRARAKKPPAH